MEQVEILEFAVTRVTFRWDYLAFCPEGAQMQAIYPKAVPRTTYGFWENYPLAIVP